MPEEEKTIPTETPDVDTSRDTDELKTMISALQTEIDSLKAELSKKEPEKPAPADFGAYFAQYMTGKKN